jgi:hypothetical protein
MSLNREYGLDGAETGLGAGSAVFFQWNGSGSGRHRNLEKLSSLPIKLYFFAAVHICPQLSSVS